MKTSKRIAILSLLVLGLNVGTGCTKSTKSSNETGNLNEGLQNSGYVSYDLPAGFTAGAFTSISPVGDSGYILGGNLSANATATIESSGSSWILARIDNSGNLLSSFNFGAPLNLDLDDGTISTSSFGAVLGTTNEGPIYIVANVVQGSVPQGVVVKLNSNGSLDTTWGDGGKLIISSTGAFLKLKSIAMDSSNGKLLVSGQLYNINPPRPVVYRVNSDGSFDSSFGNVSGHAFVEPNSPSGSSTSIGHAVYSMGVDGFFLAGSTTGGVLAKFTQDGALASSFGTNGVARTSSTSANCTWKDLKVLSNGDILVVGSDQNSKAVMSRYDSAGNLISSFGINGVASIEDSQPFHRSLEIDSQQRILSAYGLLAGASNNRFGIARFSDSGTQDTTYPTLPFTSYSSREVFDLQVLADDSVFGVGYLTDEESGEMRPTLIYFANQ